MKKFLSIISIIIGLLIIGSGKQNNVLIAGEDDWIEWNSYKIEDIL